MRKHQCPFSLTCSDDLTIYFEYSCTIVTSACALLLRCTYNFVLDLLKFHIVFLSMLNLTLIKFDHKKGITQSQTVHIKTTKVIILSMCTPSLLSFFSIKTMCENDQEHFNFSKSKGKLLIILLNCKSMERVITSGWINSGEFVA